MRYLSVCSGIEAATQAWHPLGWEPVGFSEIEPFPAAVLKHHYPQTTNYGDMTKHEQWNIPSGTIDLLVGGTPCQSFSVAGLRKGLKDPRGGLMLTFLEIAQRQRPRWIVWENVPGVLSSNGGRDFGSFLGALGELGYGWAYRVLDAQWFGVAQRRRRVFVVGCLGDGEVAAKVLFERESVRRDTPPSREKREGASANAQEGVGNYDNSLVSPTLTQCKGSRGGCSSEAIKKIEAVHRASGYRMQAFGEYADDGTASAMKARDYKDATDLVASPFLYENHPNDSRVTGPHEVAPSCVSRFGTGGGNVPLVQAVDVYNQTIDGDVAATLTKAVGGTNTSGAKVMAFKPGQSAKARSLGAQSDIACTLEAGGGGNNKQAIAFEPGIATREGNESRFVKDMSPTLRKDMGDNQVAVAVDTYNHCLQEKAVPIRSTASDICHTGGVINPADRMAVRRLTPKECERLQGFPDDYTMISWRNKSAEQCPDGPRYKALGNSMAVPCMAWIGKRIDEVDKKLTKENTK